MYTFPPPTKPRSFRMRQSFLRMANKGELLPKQDADARPAGKAPIYVRIRIGTTQADLATGVYATEAEWTGTRLRVLPRGLKPDELEDHARIVDAHNKALLKWEADCLEAYDKIKAAGKVATALGVKRAVLAKDSNQLLTLEVLMNQFIEAASKPGKNKPNTVRTYHVRRANIELYLRYLRRTDLLAAEIDMPWLVGLEEWCEDELKHKARTAQAQVRFIIQCCSFATMKGLLPSNKVLGYEYQSEIEETELTYLTEPELQAIAAAQLPGQTINEVRDAFLFLCYTGLSHVDYLRLDTGHIFSQWCPQVGRTLQWLRMRRQKTNKAFSVPFFEETEALLARYPEGIPKWSNTHFNDLLKIIAQQAGIEQHLNTRMARRTCSQRLSNMGFSDEVVAEICGHNVRTKNRSYSKVREERISHEMARLKSTSSPADHLRALLADPAQAQLLRQLLTEQDAQSTEAA